MDSTRIAQQADFAGRATLIMVFGFVMTTKTWAIITMVRNPEGASFLDLAANLASLAFVMLVVGMTIVRHRPVRNADGIEPRISALLGTGLSLAIVALPRVEIGAPLQVTALILIAIGWFLSTYVLLWLGRAFSIMAQARRLVTSGPYSIVRHPLYVCEQIAVVGIALNHLSVEAALLVIVQWLFQLRRMANEEKVLRAAFPEYDAYAKHTPKILPRPFPRFRLGHA